MTDPLDLAAVKARSAACKVSHECAHQGYGCERCEAEAVTSAADVPALVAEVERLRAVLAVETDDGSDLRVEVERLSAENARLRKEYARLDRVEDEAAKVLVKFTALRLRLSGSECAMLDALEDALSVDTEMTEDERQAALRAAGGW